MTTRAQDSITLFLCIWLFSSVAFSNGSVAPELPILAQAKSAAEFPILRRLQELTLELQLLEITIKNRRDAATEEKISTSLKEIEEEGAAITARFKNTRAVQLDGIYALFVLGQRYGRMVGVSAIEWEELFSALKEGHLTAGPISVHTRGGSLNLLTISPLTIGRQVIWKVALPAFDRKSYWVQARARAAAVTGKGSAVDLSNVMLERRIELINSPYASAEQLAKNYFKTSYTKLYSAFEDHRYAVLQRVSLARKALSELSRTSGAMGTPEEYSTLYNQVLDNLFSYGVDISLAGSVQRDFAIKGFLFADSPERSQELLDKLKFRPSAAPAAYNSPSS